MFQNDKSFFQLGGLNIHDFEPLEEGLEVSVKAIHFLGSIGSVLAVRIKIFINSLECFSDSFPGLFRFFGIRRLSSSYGLNKVRIIRFTKDEMKAFSSSEYSPT